MKTIEFTIYGKFYYYHVLLNVIMTPRHHHPLVASLVGHFWTYKAPRTQLSFLNRGVSLLTGIAQYSLKSDNKIDPGCVSINSLTL